MSTQLSKKNKTVLQERFGPLLQRKVYQVKHKYSTGEKAPEIHCTNCGNLTPTPELETSEHDTSIETTCKICDHDITLYVKDIDAIVN